MVHNFSMKLKQMKKIGLVINLNDYIQGKVYIKVKHIMFRLYLYLYTIEGSEIKAIEWFSMVLHVFLVTVFKLSNSTCISLLDATDFHSFNPGSIFGWGAWGSEALHVALFGQLHHPCNQQCGRVCKTSHRWE